MLIDNFNRIIDYWTNELNQYTFEQIITKPSFESWSLGQVYIHLIENTDYYADQINICVATNNFINESPAAGAQAMFGKNEFADELIEGPPENAFTPQPKSKDQLQDLLLRLKAKMNNAAASIATSEFKGKTKHPGLNYFGAENWLQFAEIHFRHHLRQKQRIDNFLKQLNAND